MHNGLPYKLIIYRPGVLGMCYQQRDLLCDGDDKITNISNLLNHGNDEIRTGA